MGSGLERFKLLASSVAGRPLTVEPVEPPGSSAWTDGATIFIDRQAEDRDQIRCLLVQASLLSAGSLDADYVVTLARRPALCQRYLAVEGHRVLAAQADMLPASARRLIDHEVALRSSSPGESLAIAMSREVLADPPAFFGTIRPRRVRLADNGQAGASESSGHISRGGDDALLREFEDEMADDDGALFDAVSSPVGGGGGIGKMLKKLLGNARSDQGGPPGADAATHVSRRGRWHGVSTTSTSVASIADSLEATFRRESTYPEWDLHRHRYRPNWCTVSEIEQTPSLRPFEPPDTHSLRRALAGLGREWQRRPRQSQGLDIDIDAAVAALVDLTAGSSPSEEVYIDLLRQRRDLSVLILLDISGSAAQPSPFGGIVHEHQRAAASVLVRALESLGDRVALYSFRSHGRSAVHVVPMKRFGDQLDNVVMQRLGGSSPAAYTRLGAAIRHGGAVLEWEGGTSRRLLVVLSDGLAYDHGYEGPYGESDARRALAEARRRGMGCVCLSMGAPSDSAALRRVFGTAAHARVPFLEQLPAVVGPLFRFAIRSAEAQQRTYQRKLRAKELLEGRTA